MKSYHWSMGILARFLTFLSDTLFPRVDTARRIDETTVEEFGALTSPLQTTAGVVTLLPYRHPLVRAAIIETKFHKNPKAIAFLAGVLRDYLEGVEEESRAFGEETRVMVPIPLSRERRRARGYNQVEEVVRAAGFFPRERVLKRTRDTKSQTILSRSARLANMDGAFSAIEPLDSSVTYVLIDDVLTTGATLAAARQALSEAGCCSVAMVAFAH